ncbi:MAG: helix-turn-helix domain-containing protein [Candidatus Acidiferrum sp.]
MSREHEVRFPDKFWRRSTRLPFDAKGLYAVVATFADYRTGETFVSNERLQLETGFGRDRVERLLTELEARGFIKRRRQYRKNLLAKRWIRCLKHVVSDTLNFRASSRYPENQGTENQGTILTPVKSSVTPEKEEKSSLPHESPKAERIM